MPPASAKATKKSSGTKVQPEDDGGVESLETWQERAVQRRLSGARARALARSSRFLATALELMQDSGRADFTVQDLIDRSNLSLRAFYQHFAGKEELLLALYENVQSQFIEDIRQEVSAADGPLGQLEAFCRGFLSRAESSEAVGGRIVTLYNLSLALERPADFEKVWEPHQKLLKRILTSCSRAGLVRKDLSIAQLTVLMTATLTSLGQFSMLHTGPNVELTLDDIWAWCRQSVAAPVGAATSKPSPARRRTAAAPKTTRASRR
ncbi:TetR/AcrR family transcriptional regulator [Mycolicibacterium pyrenivorans]|uniref:TetR/AcrR family transcriptional regulator n=1 Tax=Mycolicibacterium pyrenivorans TaxID=187102 RepID=UPI0021F39A51|nr:TetR/AcrR family transcriptional regulator [Mycolicibacterium pyrenivorans]MCV7151538.1 TetR/AcrR family transcriptional regulator [Mycolicibacterium pyrenivorans]